MKERIDLLLVQQGYFETREKAKRALMAGLIFVNGQRLDKAGTKVDDQIAIEVRGAVCPFVSRGGYKLDKAIKTFNIQLQDAVCMDIGASTGGFTDCMLQNGATKVYAVDVGYGQLDWKLRTDDRVVNLERTNIRYLTKDQVPSPVDFVSIDVAFISLKLVLPVAKAYMKPGAHMVALIKPQFEAGREQVGKKGVVRDQKVHEEVILNTLNTLKALDMKVLGLDYSPITGPNGNIEFLVYVSQLPWDPTYALEKQAETIVKKAHETLT